MAKNGIGENKKNFLLKMHLFYLLYTSFHRPQTNKEINQNFRTNKLNDIFYM